MSVTPTIMTISRSIEAAVGSVLWSLVPWPPGLCLLLLALFPTDARAIRVVCATVVVVFTGFGALFLSTALAGDLLTIGIPEFIRALISAVTFVAAAALAPTLRCRGVRAMQPRPALRRLWTVIRLFFLVNGVLYAGVTIADYVQRGKTFDHPPAAVAAFSATFLLCAALATPRNRGRIHRRLGRLGGRRTEAEDAAAVAALVGGSAPDAALERASKLLRCLPASRLLAADLADNMTSEPSVGPTQHARTEPAAMGEVTAFLSHSWSDEREAPGAKHALVSRCGRRGARRQPVRSRHSGWCDARQLSLHPLFSTTHALHMLDRIYDLVEYTRASRCAAGQGVYRPEQHPAVARLLARLPRGLPDAARCGWAYLLLKAVVCYGALHVRSECRAYYI